MPSDISTSARRDIARRARDVFPAMGIYIVRDRDSGQVLVASSRNVHAAINRAQFELRLRSHPDKALQAEWDRSGPERFSFEIVELLKEREDPAFDYAGELRAFEEMYRAHFAQQAGVGR